MCDGQENRKKRKWHLFPCSAILPHFFFTVSPNEVSKRETTQGLPTLWMEWRLPFIKYANIIVPELVDFPFGALGSICH